MKILLILCNFSAMVFVPQAYSYRTKAPEKYYVFPKTRFLPKVTVRALSNPWISGPHFHIDIERENEGMYRFVFSCLVNSENHPIESLFPSPKDRSKISIYSSNFKV